jgi:D-3-phosphoglycerate dehydrogenase
MNRIVVLDTGYANYAYEQDLFGAQGYRFELYQGGDDDREDKIRFAGNALGILVRGTLIDSAALKRMQDLKAIVRYGTGFENIDLQQAFSRGIRVANVQGYANHAVSDHAMGLMFACIRGIGVSWPERFGRPMRRDIFELHNKTLGIIGIGRIGSQFAMKAYPLFKQTLACDPYRTAESIRKRGAIKSELNDVLENSHVISIHCNLTDETQHMLNMESLLAVRQQPVIINTARGAVIESSALLAALNSGKVHSAGLDVFEQEPPGGTEKPLLEHPRVIATPHVAWYSDQSVKELQQRAADNLLALLQGRRVPDEIKPGNS